MICNSNPFVDSKNKNKIAPLLRNICRGAYNLNNPKLKDVPKSLKKFIKYLLVLDPSRRPTADQALHHEFMLEDFENLSGDPSIDIVEYNWMTIRKYQTKQRWKIVYIYCYYYLLYCFIACYFNSFLCKFVEKNNYTYKNQLDTFNSK